MSETAQITTSETTISAELFQAAGLPNGGAVVVAYGSDGMTEPWAAMIRDYANALSGQGFHVIIPDYLASTSTVAGTAVFDQIASHAAQWQAVIFDAAHFARTLPGINTSRIALLGFSLGGHLCLRARETARLVVEFFAPVFSEIGGIGNVAMAVPKAQIHHGLADHLVPFQNAEVIQGQLEREGTHSELFRYDGAGHGFAGSDGGNATARRSARECTLAFIQGNL